MHNDGKGAKYTKARLPVQLIYYEEFKTKSEALKHEIQIKKLTRSQKLQLIAGVRPGTDKPTSLLK